MTVRTQSVTPVVTIDQVRELFPHVDEIITLKDGVIKTGDNGEIEYIDNDRGMDNIERYIDLKDELLNKKNDYLTFSMESRKKEAMIDLPKHIIKKIESIIPSISRSHLDLLSKKPMEKTIQRYEWSGKIDVLVNNESYKEMVINSDKTMSTSFENIDFLSIKNKANISKFNVPEQRQFITRDTLTRLFIENKNEQRMKQYEYFKNSRSTTMEIMRKITKNIEQSSPILDPIIKTPFVNRLENLYGLNRDDIRTRKEIIEFQESRQKTVDFVSSFMKREKNLQNRLSKTKKYENERKIEEMLFKLHQEMLQEIRVKDVRDEIRPIITDFIIKELQMDATTVL